MSRSLQRLAVAAATVLLLTSCGSDDSGDDSDTAATSSSSESSTTQSTDDPAAPDATSGTDGTGADPDGTESSGGDSASSVARAPFCADIDPGGVGEILGLDGLSVIAQAEPGQEVTPAPGGTPVQSQTWSCTIGQTSGSSIAVTWNLGSAAAQPNDANAIVASVTGSLDPKNCKKLNDDSLGAGTRGADCSGSTDKAGGIGFTLVARALVVDSTLLECYLASTSPDDLGDLKAAAPEICALFHDRVVS